MEYRITKQQCHDKISGVCSRCGGKISPIETIDNGHNPTFWAGCNQCHCFDNGVDPKIYATAKALVDEEGWRPYSHIDHNDDDDDDMKRHKLNEQISGACRLVCDVLRTHRGN